MKLKIKGTITKKRAQQLSNNFDKYLASISGIPSEMLEYANSAWFDIKHLELFLANAKVKANNSKQVLSGIRIYFGKYPKTKENNGNLTVFIAPTIFKKNCKLEDLEDEERDMNVDALNFGQAGYPPRKTYPYK